MHSIRAESRMTRSGQLEDHEVHCGDPKNKQWIPKTSNGSQVVPAAALEAVERLPGGRVDELPRYDLPLCIQTIGPQWRSFQGGWSWGAQDSGVDRKKGSQRTWFVETHGTATPVWVPRCATWPTEAGTGRLRQESDELRSRRYIRRACRRNSSS